MSQSPSLISHLEDVVQHGTPEKRHAMLREITGLFLHGASRFEEEHVALFDELFGKLVVEIEDKARAELSRRLAPISNAPAELVKRLAKDDDIAIAGPVLMQSPRLAKEDLVAIASSKGQAHLFAISARAEVEETITDIIVRRGDRDVVRKLASNPGARISEDGYSNIAKRAEKDGVLAETIAKRADIPVEVFGELLSKATEVVQRRLMAVARPETQAEIRRVLTQVANQVSAKAAPPRDYSGVVESVSSLAASGKLGEKQVLEFAKSERYSETVAALGALSSVPIAVVDKLMHGERPDPILILCKAAGFQWDTVREIIVARPGNRGKSSAALDTAAANFDKLSSSTAQRVVRFWQAA